MEAQKPKGPKTGVLNSQLPLSNAFVFMMVVVHRLLLSNELRGVQNVYEGQP